MIKKIYLHLINILIINIIKILFFFKNKIRRIRKIEFEYFSGKYKLYSNKYFFILFGKDKYISRETYINGPHDYDLLKKSKILLSKKIKYLIDIGANIGTFCIPPIKDGIINKCIAIEPVHKINKILNTNIILNEIEKKIDTYNYVISDNTKANVYVNAENLLQFALMGYAYFSIIDPHRKPKIGLINIGTEKKKKVPLSTEIDYDFLKKKNSKKIIKLIKKNYDYISLLDSRKPEKEKIENIEKFFNKSNKKLKHFNCLIF